MIRDAGRRALGAPRAGADHHAVIGAGIVGLVTALLLAGRGHRVTVIDRRPAPWSGASAVGEGKIHLGPVYALGDRATHDLMLRGALTFAPVVEAALEREVPWGELASPPFDYLVMPTSLVGADQLAAAYRRMNNALAGSADGAVAGDYLGRPLDTIIDPTVRYDPVTGLDGFRSRERAIDPASLGRIVAEAAAAHPGITTLLDTTARSVDATAGRVTIEDGGGETHRLGPFRTVINCAWEGRSRLAYGDRPGGTPQNIRVKTAVRLRPCPDASAARAVTLVQGPFGDVVAHRDHTYASWYPLGRIHHESGVHPSPRVAEAVAAGASRELGRMQVEALARIGLLRGDEEIVAAAAGVILGDGSRDIHRLDSGLHRRARFGTLVRGRLLTPMNYKLTTAPLAAVDACEHALALARA